MWMLLGVAALVCCAIAIVIAAVTFVTGVRHGPGGPEVTLKQYGDALVYDFETLGAPEAPRDQDGPGPSNAARPYDAIPPERMNDPAADTSCAGGSWPYFSDDCLWATERPRHRHPITRARSFWCWGPLRHQPFCVTRQR